MDTFDAQDYSTILKANAFGHAIPSNATINGIEVLVKKYYGNGAVRDGLCQLTKDGATRVGNDKTFGSQYPFGQSDTYVKATTQQTQAGAAYFATDPTKSLTGSNYGKGWAASDWPYQLTNQRFHIDLGSAKTISRIYYENFHWEGTATNKGVKNFTFWGSNTGTGTFDDLVYANDEGWTQIGGALQFEEHAAVDAADPKYITVPNTTAYRYYAFKFADNWGGGYYMGIRRIELQSSPTWSWSNAIVTYGSPTDLWGATWTPAEINSSNFGVHFAAQAIGADADAYVDSIKTIVYYSLDIDPKTLTNPTPEDIESDITAGYLTVSGTNTEASSATTNANYTLKTGSFQYTIPSNTTLTPSSGTMDITSLTVSDITDTINQENPSSKGAIKIGIPNKSINFSQDITVTLSVSSTYNGKTLTIYSRPDNGETWTEESTCLVTDSQCSFTTDHATEYTGNYEVSNSPTPTDVNLGLDPTISLTCSDSITLGTITGTGQSSLATNEATCTVGTINSSGYQLSWQASTAYMENENGDQISPYTPQTPNTPETWSVASTESEWGGRIKSTSTDPDITGEEIWDSSDSYGGTWLNIATSPFVIANRITETAQQGSTETILFGAEIGSNKFQPTGTYDVDVTFTATTL